MSRVKNNVSVGNCGQYFVAAELERRGFTAAIPLSNTQDFDILAINRITNKQIAIQVKTTAFGTLQWMLSSKDEKNKGNNIYYILVHLHELETPEYYIIPSTILADSIRDKYAKKLTSLGENGIIRKDSDVRTFKITNEFEKYKNAWEDLRNL